MRDCVLARYVGDIVAAFAGAAILDSSLDWRWAIVTPLALNGLWSVVNLACVPNTPRDLGLETAETRTADAKALTAGRTKEDAPSPIGIKEAFMLPNVMGYAIAFGFFKLINYAMFFQLPVILSANFERYFVVMFALSCLLGHPSHKRLWRLEA